jgi:hypothetical protein
MLPTLPLQLIRHTGGFLQKHELAKLNRSSKILQRSTEELLYNGLCAACTRWRDNIISDINLIKYDYYIWLARYYPKNDLPKETHLKRKEFELDQLNIKRCKCLEQYLTRIRFIRSLTKQQLELMFNLTEAVYKRNNTHISHKYTDNDFKRELYQLCHGFNLYHNYVWSIGYQLFTIAHNAYNPVKN